jgi:hypothetical protein
MTKNIKTKKILKQVQNDKSVETGRSMTEMLGVLAIIGVLSVGSIAGYRYAMDNYYTNEILAGASQRALLVAAQITAGQTPSLAEFRKMNDTAGGTFDSAIKEWDGAFGIQVTKVNESVCKNLLKATEDTDIILAKTDVSDLTESDCSGDNNTFMFVYSRDMGDTPDTACLNVECPEGSTCSHGQCQCSDGLFVCGEQCCAEGTYCAKGADTSTYTCAEPTGECTKNSDCKDAEGNVDTSKYCKFSDGDCSGPTGGTCTAKGTLTPYTLTLPKGDLTVYRGGQMNWWSASNLCQAHGKQLVTMFDLGLADSGTNTQCNFDKTQSDYATKPCICNGGSDSDCSATNTAITGALLTSRYYTYIWLADNSKATSCSPRYVELEYGEVNFGYRAAGGYNALCR